MRSCGIVLLFVAFSSSFGQSERAASPEPIDAIVRHLDQAESQLADIFAMPESRVPLSQDQAERLAGRFTKHLLDDIRLTYREQWDRRELVHEQWQMPIFFKSFGKKPADGWSLYISMHGGGGTAPRVNDQQWENQKRLYAPKEGIYCAPRAPTNSWNLWHQPHIDVLFDRLIQCMVAFEDVNWDRVYVMGYSAGGDGVYQLGPRMADRWAAASMMAGHPNDASPLNLRNVPFTLQVGGLDRAFERNQRAEDWKQELSRLRAADPTGYEHLVKIYPNFGHWMQRRDAIAVDWMSEKLRNSVPTKLVWKVDRKSHRTFYWLALSDSDSGAATGLVEAEVDGQTIEITSDAFSRLTLMLDDRLVNLDQPVHVRWNGEECFSGLVSRTAANLIDSLSKRRDPKFAFSASLTIERRPSE